MSGTIAALMSTVVAASALAQSPPPPSPWRPLVSPVSVELRGLAVVNDRVAWASGAKGTVVRTLDGVDAGA